MVEVTAVGKRDSTGVRVVPVDDYIPYLNQWVRDYVDKRSVKDGMWVLVADVSAEEDGVDALRINSECASERAVREDERTDTINVRDTEE